MTILTNRVLLIPFLLEGRKCLPFCFAVFTNESSGLLLRIIITEIYLPIVILPYVSSPLGHLHKYTGILEANAHRAIVAKHINMNNLLTISFLFAKIGRFNHITYRICRF